MWSYRATLNRVIDADTFVLDLDLGFYVRTEQRIRLLGIDAYERGTPQGRQATAFTCSWFDRYPYVCVTTGKTQARSLDRWVGSVVGLDTFSEPVPGADLAVMLREAGFAKPAGEERLGNQPRSARK